MRIVCPIRDTGLETKAESRTDRDTNRQATDKQTDRKTSDIQHALHVSFSASVKELKRILTLST